ncbi:eukaryotic elongation factor-2 kinase [Capsaspora owczarzaki ATCC 30864]|uniref:Eukaryotic elongation factor-2 kinase n=1 Tax=Capsaspora owczarzaki (strain ATCC 30864) TaxID=595528 RepID=A0A0D2X0M4_CAPO3|nr:eukaryotic elongation factor-2 kinase [Capsaspora owczarzaki ATCC 30864]
MSSTTEPEAAATTTSKPPATTAAAGESESATASALPPASASTTPPALTLMAADRDGGLALPIAAAPSSAGSHVSHSPSTTGTLTTASRPPSQPLSPALTLVEEHPLMQPARGLSADSSRSASNLAATIKPGATAPPPPPPAVSSPPPPPSPPPPRALLRPASLHEDADAGADADVDDDKDDESAANSSSNKSDASSSANPRQSHLRHSVANSPAPTAAAAATPTTTASTTTATTPSATDTAAAAAAAAASTAADGALAGSASASADLNHPQLNAAMMPLAAAASAPSIPALLNNGLGTTAATESMPSPPPSAASSSSSLSSGTHSTKRRSHVSRQRLSATLAFGTMASPPSSSSDELSSHGSDTRPSSRHAKFASDVGGRAATKGVPSIRQVEYWARLKNLKELYEQDYITVTEYRERKAQLVDELTGTTCTSVTSTTAGGSPRGESHSPTTVAHRPPPDFALLASESAMKHTFSVALGTWTNTPISVKIESEPFARGGLRAAYHMMDLSEANKGVTFVAKMAVGEEEREQYFQDAEMQMFCRLWADRYNAYNPPKKIEFIEAWLISLTDRPNHPLCAVEHFIDGPYRKHNNNYGYVNDDDERNTPQAFSHFTYEASKHQLLVCDVQGVGDRYTDPQMHTIDRVGFGKGNLGIKGIEKFLQTHRCSAICRYLKLPSINAKQYDVGTIPSTRFMSSNAVEGISLSIPASTPVNSAPASPRQMSYVASLGMVSTKSSVNSTINSSSVRRRASAETTRLLGNKASLVVLCFAY